MTRAPVVRDAGEGPAIMLLHAFPCDGRLWEPQSAALLDAGWRVLVPDLPGFGVSDLPEDEPSLDVVAASMIDVLDERGIDHCILGGVSLGGYVVMAMLRQRPEIAGALILAGTKASADGDDARSNRERLARLVLESPDQTARILEQSVLPGLLGVTSHADRPEVVDTVRGWVASARPEAVAWYQRAMAVRPDSREVLSDVTVPALVVWGVEDALSPRAEQDILTGALARGEFVAVEAAGHLVGIERPDTVTAAIRQFGETVRGPRPS